MTAACDPVYPTAPNGSAASPRLQPGVGCRRCVPMPPSRYQAFGSKRRLNPVAGSESAHQSIVFLTVS